MLSYAQHMERGASLIAGIKAAALGSLFGTGLLTLITFVAGISLMSEDVFAGLLVIFLPFLIGFGSAGLGLLVFGLPLTNVLRQRGKESRNAYVVGGVFAGLIPPLLFALVVGEFDFSLTIVFAFGALTGALTGHYWWRFARKPLVESDTTDLIAQFE